MPRTKNAITNRIHVRAWLLTALVGGLPVASHAGYAQLAAPSGFGGSAGNWTFAPSANDLRYGSTAFSPNALRVPVPGSAATMPAAYRFAANAPKIAAAAIFMNPYVRAGVGIATWLSVASIFWDDVNKQWMKNIPGKNPDGNEWSFTGTKWYPTGQSACGELNELGHTLSFTFSDGWCVRSDGVSYRMQSRKVEGTDTNQVAPVPKSEFEELLPLKPMPETVPFELPKPTPLPVEQPVINPDPVANPQPKPLFVPTGDPVRNPNYNPDAPASPENQPWIQPGVRVQPSPTPSEPWRVDVQPVNRPQAGPEPLPVSKPDDPLNPDKPKTEEQQSLCEKHPDILACAKPELDAPEGEIPKTTREVTLTEENLFSGGSCPADVYFTPQGLQQLKVWDWNQSCSYITGYLKPILLICCTFAAFMILIPGRTE